MTIPIEASKIDTKKGILLKSVRDHTGQQEMGIIPLASQGGGSLGVAVNLTWIREFHYLVYYGEPLQKWGGKFSINSRQDLEQLPIWPLVAIDDPGEEIFDALYSRCQVETRAYRDARKIPLNALRKTLLFEGDVTTTLMQQPELIALIDGVPFRFPEAYFIGDMTPVVLRDEIQRDPDWFRSFDGLPSTWTGVKCELCGGSNCEVVHIIGPSRIVQCQACGLQFDNPQAIVAAGALDKYASNVRDRRKSAKSMLRASQNTDTLINGLEEINPDLMGQSVLEVGCSSGELLHLLGKRYSWPDENLWGMDLSKRAIETARAKFSLKNVFDQDLRHLHFPDRKFGIIALFNTLEHLDSPRMILSEMHRILKDDGCILIGSVPNVDCLASRLFPDGFIAKNFPDGQHHYQFSPDTLSRMCTETGFDVFQLNGESREPVMGQPKETAAWLSYSCGVPLDNCRDEKGMLMELRKLIKQFHEGTEQQQFNFEDDDFLTAETLIDFWRREIWPSPYLSDEFDIWLKK